MEGDIIRPILRYLSTISIHALRVEGDALRCVVVPTCRNFYPRPPGGGRLVDDGGEHMTQLFLSTPSGWRATLPLPVAMRAILISIHALRVEGDRSVTVGRCVRTNFYPRPPGGGRPVRTFFSPLSFPISIHALRVEGDSGSRRLPLSVTISIHALRVEGDQDLCCAGLPRARFLSTPSGWRATPCKGIYFYSAIAISIHALRVEGDLGLGAQMS